MSWPRRVTRPPRARSSMLSSGWSEARQRSCIREPGTAMSEEHDRAQFKAWLHPRSSTLFQAQAAHFHFSPDSGPIAASHRSATKSADAQRGAAHGEEWKRPPREWFEAKTQFAV